jgi:hypothetical protein
MMIDQLKSVSDCETVIGEIGEIIYVYGKRVFLGSIRSDGEFMGEVTGRELLVISGHPEPLARRIAIEELGAIVISTSEKREDCESVDKESDLYSKLYGCSSDR